MFVNPIPCFEMDEQDPSLDLDADNDQDEEGIDTDGEPLDEPERDDAVLDSLYEDAYGEFLTVPSSAEKQLKIITFLSIRLLTFISI